MPLLLQFSIALFTGMVAATLVPPVRRSIPKPIEVLLWVAFLSVCVLGVVSISDPNARELSSSAAWGIDQLINTLFSTLAGLAVGSLATAILDHRFTIATALVIAAGVDLFALVLLRSLRSARGWQPRVRLGEWMELPPLAAPSQAVASDPIAVLNRRLAAAAAVVGATLLAWAVQLTIWIRDVLLPRERRRLAHAAEAGRTHSRARLESLRDATAHLQFAARSWYVAAAAPAVSELACRASEAVRSQPARLRPGQLIDIQALLSAQSIGWYGPLSPGPPEPNVGVEDAESQRSDRLAS